jgi:hypothetical protein
MPEMRTKAARRASGSKPLNIDKIQAAFEREAT